MNDGKDGPPSNVTELIRKPTSSKQFRQRLLEPEKYVKPDNATILQALALVKVFFTIRRVKNRKQVMDFAVRVAKEDAAEPW
jgi:hypothetical protein